MLFVNQVAEIVHRVVDQHLGATNNNLGQAFLVVWQISHFEAALRPKIADLSVMSFIKVAEGLVRDKELAKFGAHPLLVSRMPDFRVSCGFGLHLGWAIAGGIGSEFKIDASYLSPDVTLAAQLEEATSEYGVSMLMSGPLVRLCNVSFSRHFRPVDQVKLTGCKNATQLFTMDLDTSTLSVDRVVKRRNPNRHSHRRERERRRRLVLQEDFQVHELLLVDKSVRQMREHLFLGFFQEFERGFLNYLAGEWDVAAEVLARTRNMLVGHSQDGPSCALLEYMQAFDYQAPAAWLGWRELHLR